MKTSTLQSPDSNTLTLASLASFAKELSPKRKNMDPSALARSAQAQKQLASLKSDTSASEVRSPLRTKLVKKTGLTKIYCPECKRSTDCGDRNNLNHKKGCSLSSLS